MPLADAAENPYGGQVVFAGRGPEGWLWVHLKRSHQTEAALHASGRLPGEVVDALLERDTLPRALHIEDWTVLILRAINATQGAEPEDMISLRLACRADEIVSVEGRRLRQIDRRIAAFRQDPPPGPAGFIAQLIGELRAEVEPVLGELEADIAGLERRMLRLARGGNGLTGAERAQLTDARQDAIQLHRYLAPQAMALDALLTIKPVWLAEKRRLRAETAGFRRIAADLEALRQRAQLVAEEASMATVERTNHIMLTLSAVSVVFLPITALTGLLGVNLAGIPFAEAPWAFAGFCGLLALVAGLGVWLALRLLR